VTRPELFRDDERDHGVTEELEPVVGMECELGMLVREAAVHEGLGQQREVREGEAEPGREVRGQVAGRVRRVAYCEVPCSSM
jgi:hypothetical protein